MLRSIDAQHSRNGKQRQRKIVRRQCIVSAQHGRNAWRAREYPGKRVRSADDHPRTAFAKGRRKAHELQRVAQALLGGQQDRAAGQGLALPARRRRRCRRAERLRAMTPLVFAPALGVLTGDEQRQRQVPVRLREVRRHAQRLSERGSCLPQIVRGLQRQSQVVPRGGQIRLPRQRLPIVSDGLVCPVRGSERQSQVVVELRLLRNERYGTFEERQRLGNAVALIVDHAQVMQGGRMIRRFRQRGAVVALGGCDFTALMRLHAACSQSVRRECGGGSGKRGRRRICAHRAVTLFVALAASARARVVAADAQAACGVAFRLREQCADFFACRICCQDPLRDRDGRRPLSRRQAIVEKVRKLRGTRDAVGKERNQLGKFGRRHDLPEIEQAVEAERSSDRIRGLERELVCQGFAAKAYPVLAFEQRPKRAADGGVLGLDERDARVRERCEQAARAQRKAAVANPHAIAVPEPLGAQVVALEERRVPGTGIDDIAVPLHKQNVLRVHKREQCLQDEIRIGIA